jgi:hypothetical protein
MRFLANLNIESPVITRLREKNHDVRSAAEDFAARGPLSQPTM